MSELNTPTSSTIRTTSDRTTPKESKFQDEDDGMSIQPNKQATAKRSLGDMKTPNAKKSKIEQQPELKMTKLMVKIPNVIRTSKSSFDNTFRIPTYCGIVCDTVPLPSESSTSWTIIIDTQTTSPILSVGVLAGSIPASNHCGDEQYKFCWYLYHDQYVKWLGYDYKKDSDSKRLDAMLNNCSVVHLQYIPMFNELRLNVGHLPGMNSIIKLPPSIPYFIYVNTIGSANVRILTHPLK